MAQLTGLYAITDSQLLPGDKLIAGVTAAIAGGAQIIQYREKSTDQTRRMHEATQLRQLCHRHGITLIINDDVALAAEIGADGVHLGRDDGAIESARQQLPNGIIGVSCYNDWPRAEMAQAAGADYVAFGAFYPSSTKPNAVTADTSLLTRAHQTLEIPVVAIGGITAENGATLIDAGADMLAVVQGIFGQPNIGHAAKQYAQLFNNSIYTVKDAI